MSLITQIQEGLNAAFTAQLNDYKTKKTAEKDQLIWDGATGKTVQAETWYRWVNTSNGWVPKYQTGTIPKSPVSSEHIAEALATFTKTLQEQRAKITGFDIGSDDTQYLYLNVVDGEKVKVIELKLSIRPHVAVQTATIYHFDDEADETVQARYQPTLKFEGQANPAQITVKRLKKSEQGLVKDVVNLQVALLNQKAIGFEEEAYVAPVVMVEQQRDPSPTTSTEEQAKVIQPETAKVTVVAQQEEQPADNNASANAVAVTTVVAESEEQADANTSTTTSTEEQAKELHAQVNQADEERFNRETAAKAAAIAAAQPVYDAVLAQRSEAAQSMKDTAAALEKAEKDLSSVAEQHSQWKPASAPTRLQHFFAENKMQVRLLKAITLTLFFAAIITIAALKLIEPRLILGIFAAALLTPSIIFLPFLSFKKPAPVSTINPFQEAYDSALSSKNNAQNALVKENAFEARLAAAKAALDKANAIVVAPLTVVTAVVGDPLAIQENPASTHPLQNMKYQSMYNFVKMPSRQRTNSNGSSDSGKTAQSDSATTKPVVYIRKTSRVIENPASGIFVNVDLTKKQIEEYSNSFSDDEIKALLADNPNEAKNMKLTVIKQ